MPASDGAHRAHVAAAAKAIPTHADLALALTLLALVLEPIGAPWLRVAALAAASAGLLFRRVRHAPALWLGLAGLAALRVALDWPLSDNHAYLLAYWCLGCGLSLRDERPEAALAWNGRVLVGLVFAFATAWKLASPDFLDGTFFRATLILDGRFAAVPRWLGGLEPDVLASLADRLAAHVDFPAGPYEGVPLPRRLVVFAGLATAFTLAIEAALAVAFLAPARVPAWARDALLLSFCAITYALAPVAGFGWLLLAMGLAQSDGRRRTVSLYLVTYGLVLLYREAPWNPWLVGG